MLEVGREKVKIGDEQNGEALCNIDPKQPFHGMGLAGKSRQRQFSLRAEGGPAPSICRAKMLETACPQAVLRLLKTFGG